MAEDLAFWVGETKRIIHTVTSDDPFTISAVAIKIYASDRSVDTNAAGSWDSTKAAISHDIWYNWTPGAADDYTYLLTYTVGSGAGAQTLGIRGEVTALQIPSWLPKWTDRIARWIRDEAAGEASALLSFREYVDCARKAVVEYQRVNPQVLLYTENLSNNVFDYSLPTGWKAGFSAILKIEYPVDDTRQDRLYLLDREYEWDDLLGTYRFLNPIPQTGQTARVYYTAPHTLSDETDTIPDNDFESVTQYAAGIALDTLANRAASTSSPTMTGAEMVNYRTKQQEYSAQAKRMMDQARAFWGPGLATAVIAEMPYLPYHGRVIYWQY